MDIKRMKEIVKILEPAARAYYMEGKEIMSNYEYDKLYDELLALEAKTGIVLAGSPTQKVGYDVITSLPKKKHPQPMLSLDKTKSVEALTEKVGDKKGFLSWKLDGLTIVLTYDGGELVEAVTRGNGEVGEVITPNAKYFSGVPLVITEKNRKVIRGEATISYSSFKKINMELPEGTEPYKNPRNLCSGTIRNLDPQIVAERNVAFFAFDYVMGSNSNSHEERLRELEKLGFGVVEGKTVTKETLADTVAWFSEKIKTNDFPSDGLVLVYDDIAYGKSLGTTSKFPRSGLAFKWKDEVAETKIKEIDWSVSRTGLINPVAIFETVELEGTSVSRASLHNLSIMKELKVGIGDTVKVIKANMIIPQIVENVTKSGTVSIPNTCPICGATTEVKTDKTSGCETLYCTGDNCLAKAVTKISHFVSRDAMNIVGISEKTIEAFLEAGILSSAVDLYSIENKRELIVNMEGFGGKSYEKMIDAINGSKHIEMYKFLYALGIPNFGLSNSKNVCRELGLSSHLDCFALSKEDLIEVDGVGEVMAQSFVDYFADENNKKYVADLVSHISFVASNDETTNVLDGLTFVVTGKINRMSRKELQELIEKNGGKLASSVSAKTTALINNDNTSSSSKNTTAKSLNVDILTEDEFFEKYNL